LELDFVFALSNDMLYFVFFLILYTRKFIKLWWAIGIWAAGHWSPDSTDKTMSVRKSTSSTSKLQYVLSYLPNSINSLSSKINLQKVIVELLCTWLSTQT